MANLNFFNKKKEYLTIKEICEITGASPSKEVNLETKIFDIATLQSANEYQISFLNSGQYLEKFLSSKAGFCFIEEKYQAKLPENILGLIHKNPYFCYAQIANSFWQEKSVDFTEKLIHPSAKIGKNVKIAANAFIGANVEIGDNVIIHPSVVIHQGCKVGNNSVINAGAVISFAQIGDNCIIYNGAKIGQDGFGFAHEAGVNHKIIQLGFVEVGTNVEIGANSCIDRGAIENTVIGDGVKIDNLNQIGHNVIIGKGSVIAGCCAIAGSAKIGNFVQIGGNTSIAGHITIGDGVKIAGMSGVMRDVEPAQVIAGLPSMPIKKWHRLNTILLNLLEKK